MTIELKPCPFCGGEASVYDWQTVVGIGCSDENCPGSMLSEWCFATTYDAAEVWNTRAERMCRRTLMDITGNPPYYTGGLALNDTCNGCSECGYPWRTHGFDHPNFCPNCGAKVVE